MYLSDGLQIDSPAVVVPWLISEDALQQLLPDSSLRRVTTGYYTLRARVWGGIELVVGFHFDPRRGGSLREFEIFRPNPDEMTDQESYRELQDVLETRLGPPTESVGETGNYPSAAWYDSEYSVRHLVQNRFGDEEILRIKTSRAA